jgi:hypothetical protein
MLDAYTVRKAVPRILFAVIGINLSIYLCLAAIDISRIVGNGIDSLLMSAFKDANSFAVVSPEGSLEGGVLAGILAISSIWAIPAALGGLLPLLTLVALIALAILFTLVVWQGLLIFLAVVSPVAIACFVLPGTEKYFQKWLDLFVRTLMIYPIIMVILAMSKVLASILIGTSSLSGNDSIGALKAFAAIVVIYAPLALIPFAFKLAGGAIGAVAGMAINRAQQKGAAIGQGMRQNPDSLHSRIGRRIDSKKSDIGFTGGQMWAGAAGGFKKGQYSSRREARRAKIGAAKEFDQFRNRQATMDTGRYKMNAQDSDALDSAVMNSDQVALDKANLAKRLQLQRDINAGRVAKGTTIALSDGFGGVRDFGGVSENEYQRKMQGHARADAMGRTTANRLAAFNSADRIKFTGNTHENEVALAQDILGNNSALIGGAMNEHQAIAKGAAGRPDLSRSLYGDDESLDRASESQSMYMLMNQGRPGAIKNFADQHMARLKSATATNEEKRRSAAFLQSMKNSKGQGTEANNAALNAQLGNIDQVLDQHLTEQAAIAMTSAAPIARERRVKRTITDPVTGVQTTRDDVERVVLTTPAEREAEAKRQAGQRLQQEAMGYNQPDPSELNK